MTMRGLSITEMLDPGFVEPITYFVDMGLMVPGLKLPVLTNRDKHYDRMSMHGSSTRLCYR
jgi:hypothetical protein